MYESSARPAMHPGIHAATHPDKPAYVMAGSGETVTYAELEARSNQYAQLFRSLGLGVGDSIAILMENHPRFYEIVWGAQRAGLYYTPVSHRLMAGEVAYILEVAIDEGGRGLEWLPLGGAERLRGHRCRTRGIDDKCCAHLLRRIAAVKRQP